MTPRPPLSYGLSSRVVPAAPLVLVEGGGGRRQRLAACRAPRLPVPSLERNQGRPEMRSEGGGSRWPALWRYLSLCHFADCVCVARLNKPAFHLCCVGCAVGGIYTHSPPLSPSPFNFGPCVREAGPGARMAPGKARRPQESLALWYPYCKLKGE